MYAQARGAESYGDSAKDASQSIYRLPMQPQEFMHFLTSWSPKPLKPRVAAPKAKATAAACAVRAGALRYMPCRPARGAAVAKPRLSPSF